MSQSRLLADNAPVALPFLRRLFRRMAIPGILLLTGCGGGGSSSTPRSYSLQELKSASQVYSIEPGGLNNSGQVVGLEFLESALTYHAFLYANGSLQDISAQSGIVLQQGIGINDAGQILCRGVYQSDPAASSQAFLYSQGKAVALDPADATSHNTAAINAAGQIAGDDGTHVALYTKGVWQELGAPPGAVYVTAACLNTQGHIAGSFYDANQISHVFLYKKGTFTDVDAVANDYAVHVVGIDDNDAITFSSGSVGGIGIAGKVIARGRATSNPSMGVFVWDAAHGVQALPVPANAEAGDVELFVSAVNHQGDILGGYFFSRDTSAAGTVVNTHLVVWHNRKGTDITALTPALASLNLTVAYAPSINDHGQILVEGTARQSNGQFISGPLADHTFVLTPQ